MAYNAQLLNGMVIFVEVVNTGSFTLAAQSSGHSTSYISKEINKLESRLSVRLMHRTTRSLRLTPEGEIYFLQCQQIMSDAEQAEETLNGRQLEPKGTLRVSCPTSFGNSRMQTILSQFLNLYPQVNLELDLDNRKVDMVTEGFDVLIRGSEMELSLCLAGHGITRMPRFNLGDEIETGKLVELFNDYQHQEINVYLIYPSRKHVSSKVRHFIDFVTA
ncbi:MAG: DNA-binding transcriptional LysR family regulator [Moritella dasanensis]